MTRILYISPQPFFEWRGSPIRVGFTVKALAELGYEVDLLTLPVGERKEIPAVTIIRVANLFRVKKLPIGPSLFKFLFDFLLIFKGAQLVLKNKYDVIHGVEEAGSISVMLSRLNKGKAIFEKHSDPFSYRKGFVRNLILSLYSKVEHWTVKRSNAVIATGEGLVNQVVKMKTGTPVFHIFDIPSSLKEISDESGAQIAKELKSVSDEILVTFVGSFAIYQGIDLMISTIPIVLQTNSKARFIVIGGTETEIQEKKTILKKQGADESVTFLGKIPPDELPNYLAASEILLAPRLSGVNTPLKLLDYFKAGRAIVATDVNANRLILDEQTAVLVDAEPKHYAAGICRLVDDEVLRKKLGENGNRRYRELYNFFEFKQRLSHCYNRVLA